MSRNQKIVIDIFWGTLLSVLVFFSISFLTFLWRVNPLGLYENPPKYKLNIGFPFTYYYEFWLRCSDAPNAGWELKQLFLDILLTWVIVAGLYVLIQKRRNNYH